jgi:hypothetical protein
VSASHNRVQARPSWRGRGRRSVSFADRLMSLSYCTRPALAFPGAANHRDKSAGGTLRGARAQKPVLRTSLSKPSLRLTARHRREGRRYRLLQCA